MHSVIPNAENSSSSPVDRSQDQEGASENDDFVIAKRNTSLRIESLISILDDIELQDGEDRPRTEGNSNVSDL